MKSAIIVPTLNAGDSWGNWISALQSQSVAADVVIVVDSGSDDNTRELAINAGFDVREISKKDFNHGGTRQSAVERLKDYDIVIFLTQDAILHGGDSIENILSPFSDSDVAAVCGRQLPRINATAIEAHARLFNYPDVSFVRTIVDKKRLGLKAVFLSNSFAAYRVSALLDVGGFPDDVIFGEDMCVAARLLLSGSKIAYVSDACVFHSHDYSLAQEFNRYFDIGVLHARQGWIRAEFGDAESEGRRFILSELAYLYHKAFWRVPEALIRSLLKYAGFRLGRIEAKLPEQLNMMCSMNKVFFESNSKSK